MKAKKVLFITQEITPYVPESPMSLIGRKLPQAVQENGREIRTFTPKWGIINERRNQLHEVIRLSGMNMIIDDTDHPLIIKVASIQSARMQVYFIDNDDYFHPRQMTTDENGVEYEDNDERAIFYARGVLETVKKLRWCPDIIHCHGWISALIPLYIKTAYREEPSFRDSRVVYSMYDDGFQNCLKEDFKSQVLFKDMTAEQLEGIGAQVNATELNKLAIQYSDGLIQSAPNVHPELMEYAQQRGILTLPYQGEENYAGSFCDFYDQVWSVGKEEVIEEEE
ncbi:MAG: glycogen/starch synthase [Bacteroidaceae bacterium]|nr:glycogen/starch synthase [Bacteroidaceae bacterium]